MKMTFVNPDYGERTHLANAPEDGLAKTVKGCWKEDCPKRTKDCERYELVEVAICKEYYEGLTPKK